MKRVPMIEAVSAVWVVGVVGVVCAVPWLSSCAVGECQFVDSWCEGDVMVTCSQSPANRNEFEVPVGTRVEVDCRAAGEAIGVAQTCHEPTTGQTSCVVAPLTTCAAGEPQPACLNDDVAATCASFQSGDERDGPFVLASPCRAGTQCVNTAENGGQCVE